MGAQTDMLEEGINLNHRDIPNDLDREMGITRDAPEIEDSPENVGGERAYVSRIEDVSEDSDCEENTPSIEELEDYINRHPGTEHGDSWDEDIFEEMEEMILHEALGKHIIFIQ